VVVVRVVISAEDGTGTNSSFRLAAGSFLTFPPFLFSVVWFFTRQAIVKVLVFGQAINVKQSQSINT